MNTERRSSLLGTIIGLMLQALAWILPNAPQELRIFFSVASILIVMSAQSSRYESIKAWLYSVAASITANYALILSVLLSIGVLIGLSYMERSELVNAAQFIVTGFLAASLVLLL